MSNTSILKYNNFILLILIICDKILLKYSNLNFESKLLSAIRLNYNYYSLHSRILRSLFFLSLYLILLARKDFIIDNAEKRFFSANTRFLSNDLSNNLIVDNLINLFVDSSFSSLSVFQVIYSTINLFSSSIFFNIYFRVFYNFLFNLLRSFILFVNLLISIFNNSLNSFSSTFSSFYKISSKESERIISIILNTN